MRLRYSLGFTTQSVTLRYELVNRVVYSTLGKLAGLAVLVRKAESATRSPRTPACDEM